MSGNEPRGTTRSKEQKEILSRPRKKANKEVVAILSGFAESVTDNTIFVNQVIPFDCELCDVTFVVKELSIRKVTANIISKDQKSQKGISFDLMRGVTEIDEIIEVKKGTIIKVRLDYPEPFVAKDVYFSASIKR